MFARILNVICFCLLGAAAATAQQPTPQQVQQFDALVAQFNTDAAASATNQAALAQAQAALTTATSAAASSAAQEASDITALQQLLATFSPAQQSTLLAKIKVPGTVFLRAPFIPAPPAAVSTAPSRAAVGVYSSCPGGQCPSGQCPAAAPSYVPYEYSLPYSAPFDSYPSCPACQGGSCPSGNCRPAGRWR